MDLEQLRKQIDIIDNQILSDFEKRMDLCRQVAIYKIENNLKNHSFGTQHPAAFKNRLNSIKYSS